MVMTRCIGTSITENIKQFATRPVDEKEWDDFARRSYYIQGDFKAIETFKHLAGKIADAQKTWNLPGNVLFYLAVAPTFFATVVEQLHAVGLTNEASECLETSHHRKAFRARSGQRPDL